MHFLEPPRVMRTPSTEEFVIDEEGSDVDVSSRRGSLSNSSQSTDFPLPEDEKRNNHNHCPEKAWSYEKSTVEKKDNSKCIIVILSIFLFIFISACGVLTFLYSETFPSYEVCRSKECTKTATSFLRSMDDTVDPCEDFQKFACGNWLNDIASSVSVGTYDHTTVMRDRVIGRLRVLTENISDTDIEPLRQVKYMYDTCTNTTNLENLGLSPLISLLDQVMEPKVPLAKLIARIKRATGQHYLFDLTIGADYRNTSRNTIFIDQPQLPVDSSSFEDDAEIGNAYKKLIDDSLHIIHTNGYSGSSNILSNNLKFASKKISDLEQKLSQSLADIHSVSKAALFNLMSLRELNQIFERELQLAAASRNKDAILNSTSNSTSNSNSSYGDNSIVHNVTNFFSASLTTDGSTPGIMFNWTDYLTEMFQGIPEAAIDDNTLIIVTDIAYIKTLAQILANLSPEDMELYLSWQVIYSFGKDVSKEFRTLFYTFTQLQDGSETIPNRRTECLNMLDFSLPYALTYKYVNKFVADEIISEAHEMVQNLIKAFKTMVSATSWMDGNTKYRAKLKADRMRAFMGYPNWMKNESAVISYHEGLSMSPASFFQNIVSLQSWLTMKDLKKIGLEVDSTWISDSPAEADAFYDDEMNAITFPSGFLQEPFFGMGLRSINYGALGAVIGHEITHGFDTRGRFSDESGRLQSWWSLDTLMHFVTKSKCFVKQYNNFTLPELADALGEKNHLNGARTQAENIADNGGVREAFLAYKLFIEEARGGKEEARLPGLEKYKPEQLFFLSFAQSWCSYMNSASLLDNVLTNEHSPSRFRILGPLTNFKEFSDVWQCKEGSFMNPKHKCVLW